MNKNILKLPKLPNFESKSPKIVQVMDSIRFENKTLGEFYWFAREYPRIFRHHFDHAEYCLEQIYQQYERSYLHFSQEINKVKNVSGLGYSHKSIRLLFWNFEVYLTSINSSLDILARIIGTAYSTKMPNTFNKICKKNTDNLICIFINAQKKWVSKMKEYRDCFIHYTPIDTILNINCNHYSDGWEVRCKIPINPKTRHIIYFKFRRSSELLRYSIYLYRRLVLFDKEISAELLRQYKNNEYPKRKNDLFKL